MPSRKLHDLLNSLLLGDSFSWVSGYMDRPYAVYRYKHRHLRHSTATIIRMLKEHGVRPALAAWLHLVLDADRELKRDVEKVQTLKEVSASSKRNDENRDL